jgi:L-fuconolactonase
MIPEPASRLIEIIDPHVHLFALEHGQYHWLKSDNPPYWPDKHLIQHSFTVQNLRLSAPFTLSKYVHIEAGFDNQQPWLELDYLEQPPLTQPTLPFNAIACCDLTLSSDAFIQQITKLTSCASFVGVRHILDEQALSLLTSPQVLKNLTYLSDQAILFEAQFDVTDNVVVEWIYELFATNTPFDIMTQPLQHTWVINHVGLGAMSDATHNQWIHNLKRLALIPNLKVKASGWEMAQRNYSEALVSYTLKTLLAIWGEERIMLASNFPLTLFSCSYQRYWERMLQALEALTLTQKTQRALLSQNALETYFTIT